MKIRSASHLTTDNCLSLTIYVVYDKETDCFLSTFELVVPDEDVDMGQYDTLLEGIAYTQYKMEQLMEDLEGIEDE